MQAPVGIKPDCQHVSEMVAPKQKSLYCTRRQFICQGQCHVNLGLSLPSVGCTILRHGSCPTAPMCILSPLPERQLERICEIEEWEGSIVLRNTAMLLLRPSRLSRHNITTTTSLLINAQPVRHNEKQRRPRPNYPRLRSPRLHSLHLHRPLRHGPAPPDPRLLVD
jgi:hypothetical protein